MPVTMKDIAKMAGVSRPVVCAVLGGRSTCHVSDVKRKRILELVEELGYQPNVQARGLRLGKTCTVGILLASFRDRIIGDIMIELYRALLSKGYTSIISIWEKEEEIEQAYRNVVRNNVDGIITCDYHPEWFREPVPTVIYGRTEPGIDSLSIDYEPAFNEAVDYLHSLGHSRIGYIGSRNKRHEAYALAMKRYGRPNRNYFFDGMGFPENGIRGMQYFLSLKERPTALLCHNDSVALSAMAEAQRRGLKIGSDISIIGADNTLESAFSCPSLTTIDTFITGKAGMMVDMLVDRIEHPEKKTVSAVLKSRLVVRESCGPVRHTKQTE